MSVPCLAVRADASMGSREACSHGLSLGWVLGLSLAWSPPWLFASEVTPGLEGPSARDPGSVFFIRSSADRQSCLQAHRSTWGPGLTPVKLPSSCQARWTSHRRRSLRPSSSPSPFLLCHFLASISPQLRPRMSWMHTHVPLRLSSTLRLHGTARNTEGREEHRDRQRHRQDKVPSLSTLGGGPAEAPGGAARLGHVATQDESKSRSTSSRSSRKIHGEDQVRVARAWLVPGRPRLAKSHLGNAGCGDALCHRHLQLPRAAWQAFCARGADSS